MADTPKVTIEVDIDVYMAEFITSDDEDKVYELLEEIEYCDEVIKAQARHKTNLIKELKGKLGKIPYEAIEYIDQNKSLETTYQLQRPGYSGCTLGSERDEDQQDKEFEKELEEVLSDGREEQA